MGKLLDIFLIVNVLDNPVPLIWITTPLGLARGIDIVAHKARTKAKMSVGFVGVDSRINDIIFDFDPKDKHTFKKELLKYMTILNKI